MTEWIKSHSKPTLEQMLQTPFYVVSDTDNTLTWTSGNSIRVSWSLNEDLTEGTEMPANATTEVPMQAGKKVYLFCTKDQIPLESCNLNCVSAFSVGGNVCFLSEASCYEKTDFQPKCSNEYQFCDLFYNTKVVDASKMVLGFRSLSYSCCSGMFNYCTSLVNAPLFPATTLDERCYYYMFKNCTKVTDLHFPKSLENDATFLAMEGAPKFGATNATVHYDL